MIGGGGAPAAGTSFPCNACTGPARPATPYRRRAAAAKSHPATFHVLRFMRTTPGKPGALWTDMRWVIGDIHGMLRPLAALLDEVRRDDRSPEFHFVGDYV